MKKFLALVPCLLFAVPLLTQALIVSPANQGGTGIGTAVSGDIGSCLKVTNNSPFTYILGTCGSGGGGTGGGTFSTTTSQVSGQLINYPTNTTDIVNIGSNSTTTGKFWFDPNALLAKFVANFWVTGSTTLNTFSFNTAIGTQATTSSFAIRNILSSLLKTNGSGSVVPAISGTDYENPLTFSTGLNRSVNVINCLTASGSVFGCLTSADWTTFNNKQASGNYITALTGDVTASGPNSAAATLATVNGNVGSFTNASITVNGKGLITAASNGSTGSSTLLADNNTFSGNNTFASLITGSVSGNAGTATKWITGRTLAITGDLIYTSPSFDGSGNVTAAGTLATVNSNVGSFGGTNSIPSFTVNGKGLITAASANVPSIPASEITSGTFGSGTYTFPNDLIITGNGTSTAWFATTASSTNLFSTNANLSNFTLTSAIGSGIRCAQFTATGLLQANASACGTGSSASTTLYADNGNFSGLNSFTNLLTANNLLVTGSSTLQNFTGLNSTTTNATSTTLFATTASSTNLYVSTGPCNGSNALNVVNGKVVCGAVSGTGSSATSTLLGDNNNFSGANQFASILINGSTTLQNFTALQATTSQATTTRLAITGIPSAILLTNAGGSVVPYTGTTCTNQFVRILSALGVATCASVANTDLVNSSLTVNGTAISLGSSGTITAASSTYLGDNNNHTGGNTFANGTTTNWFSGTASSTNLFATNANLANFTLASAIGSGTRCAQFTALGVLQANASACGTGGSASTTLLSDNNNFTGNNTFSSILTAAITGNAGSATVLQNARTINGTSFNGSANITITAASSTLLSDNNAFTGNSTFNKATSSSFAITSILSKLLKTDASGNIIPAIAGTDYENPLTFGTGVSRSVNAVTCNTASTSIFGCLLATDFTNFNNKISSSSLSGASVISYTPATGIITTTGGTFGTGNYVFPTDLTVTGNATSTAFFSTTASSTNLFSTNGNVTNLTLTSAIGVGTRCAQFSATGVLSANASACGSGGGSTNTDKFATTTSAFLSITPNGGNNVALGIGTSTPAWALQVSSSTRPQLALSDGSLTNNIWTMRAAGGNLYFATASPATFATSTVSAFSVDTNGLITSGAGFSTIGSSTFATVTMTQASSTTLYVNTRELIGTTTVSNAGRLLTVYGTAAGGIVDYIRAPSGVIANNMYGTFNVALKDDTGVNGSGPTQTFSYINTAGVANILADFGAYRDGADNTGSMIFRPTNAGSSINAMAMRNSNMGIVGVGTSTPYGALNISQGVGGNINIFNYPQLVISDFGGGTNLKHIFASSTKGNLTFGSINDSGTVTTEVARLNTSTATFGIGTTSPMWTLTLSSSTLPQLALTDASLTSDIWTMRNAGSQLYFATSSPSTFATSSVSAFSISSSGIPTFPSLGGVVGCAQFNTAGTMSNTGSACGSGGGGGGNSKFATSTGAYFGITPNGGVNVNVGIGTTTPVFTLSVASSTGPQFSLINQSATTNAKNFLLDWTGGGLYFGTSSDSTFTSTSTFASFTNIGGPARLAINSSGGLTYTWGQDTKTILANPNFRTFANSSVALFLNTNTSMNCGQVSFPNPITVNSITVNAGGVAGRGGTAGQVKFALYTSDGQAQVLATTTFISTTGGKTFALTSPVAVSSGVYYQCVVPVGTADVDVETYTMGGASGFASFANPTGLPVLTGTTTVTAGTLPSTFSPTTMAYINNTTVVIRYDN